jgi:hypothetical protein
MNDLIHHMESHLGKIDRGWSRDIDGHKLPFQVVLFERGPIDGAKAIATLGLSDIPLKLTGDDRLIRQELVMLFRETLGHRNLPGIIQQVAMEAIGKGRGYLHGEVIGPRGRLVEGCSLSALYVAVPVYFPDTFYVFRPPSGDPVVFAWLVPVSEQETKCIRDRGWAEFEERLADRDPDLLDFNRESLC